MRSIQDVGLEIFEHKPKKFYIFCGDEYGIKSRYLDMLKDAYNGEYKSYDSLFELIKMLSTKRLIPLPPMLHVIRYDLDFLSKLNNEFQNVVKNLNFKGTIVLIYQDKKDCQKASKYLDEYCVSIDKVSDKFVQKYIHQDFPNLSQRLTKLAVDCSTDYNQARMIAKSLSTLTEEDTKRIVDKQLIELFKDPSASTESMLRQGVAARNFTYCLNVIDRYESLDNVYYTILQTLIDIDKCMDSKYANSDVRKYIKAWTRYDVYTMFDNVYEELKISRSKSVDMYSSIVSLLALLTFKQIPQRRALE